MKTVSEIKAELETVTEEELEELIAKYRQDGRAGVRRLAESAQKKLAKLEAERKRMWQMTGYEREYAYLGRICGIDEAGRGPLAGPVVAGAVILPADQPILWLNDSKQLSARRREELYDVIMEKAVAV